MRVIYLIIPYKIDERWVFDDATLGIVQEPFIYGHQQLIDQMVRDIPGAEKGFRLLFSNTPFEGSQFQLQYIRGENIGNWFYNPELNQQVSLSYMLYRYFTMAPENIYLKLD